MKKTTSKKSLTKKPPRKKSTAKRPASKANTADSAALLIDEKIKALGDWRGETLAHVRRLIKQADPDVTETVKWGGVPVWEHDGIICTGETYKEWVKLTFAKGATLSDPAKLFNSSLDGNVRRAIDIRVNDELDESAFKTLIREAATLNKSNRTKKNPRK